MLNSIGPIDFEYDRTDHPLSPEPPVEAYVLALEEKRSPRPILKLIGPTNFFAERQVGGEGGDQFFWRWRWPIMMMGRGERFSGITQCYCGKVKNDMKLRIRCSSAHHFDGSSFNNKFLSSFLNSFSISSV
jgi:hypothetical protein